MLTIYIPLKTSKKRASKDQCTIADSTVNKPSGNFICKCWSKASSQKCAYGHGFCNVTSPSMGIICVIIRKKITDTCR